MAVFSVAASESPELPTSRRKREDGNVTRWPTIPRDRTGSRRTRSIRNQGVDRDAAHASGRQEMSGTSLLAGDSPTPLYSCAPSKCRHPAACDDDERPRLRLRARLPRIRCAGGRGSRTGGRPRRRTWAVECRSPCPAGGISGLQWALKCGENSALARCAARRMLQGCAGRLQRRGGEGPRMVRDRSLVRRGGGLSGRNSDVDKRAPVW